MRPSVPALLLAAAALLPAAPAAAATRSDGAQQVPIRGLPGSLQNPCWDPTSEQLAITQWRAGYNAGERADVWVVSSDGGRPTSRVSPGRGVAVNMPGSCWNEDTNRIGFAAEIDFPDQVFLAQPNGLARRRVTNRPRHAAFEPTLSPDGRSIVFESHVYDADDPGQIWRVQADGTGLRRLSAGSDDRQPNWSPAGNRIVFQRQSRGQWDVWTMDPNGRNRRNLTRTPRVSETDVSWSASGRFLVYSSDGPGVDIASLFTMRADGSGKQRLTRARGYYDGAPGWSQDGFTIAFESRRGEPDDSPGTTIWTIRAPAGRT